MGLCRFVSTMLSMARPPASQDDPREVLHRGRARRRLRILHLAYQDPAMPHSGGGAERTLQIDARLASDHDVLVVCMNWRGARSRVDRGVQYVHVGLAAGQIISTVTYFLALPVVVRRCDADLIVEDFAAPMSSALIPLWTRRPTIASVQWLNAREKSRQYRLPFFLFEEAGLRLHRRFVVMSEDLAERVQSVNPRAIVTVIPNGVPAEASRIATRVGDSILYLGRLESAQKGVDLLLRAFARVADSLDCRLSIAGDGPDAVSLHDLADHLGIGDRVDFMGWIEGKSKLESLASARIVVVPSRFETFGMVAAEALACGTPVLAFDIPCLRDVVPASCGRLVRAFDIDALGEQMVAMLADPASLETMGEAGRRFAARFDWDRIACEQESVYREAARPRRSDPTV